MIVLPPTDLHMQKHVFLLWLLTQHSVILTQHPKASLSSSSPFSDATMPLTPIPHPSLYHLLCPEPQQQVKTGFLYFLQLPSPQRYPISYVDRQSSKEHTSPIGYLIEMSRENITKTEFPHTNMFLHGPYQLRKYDSPSISLHSNSAGIQFTHLWKVVSTAAPNSSISFHLGWTLSSATQPIPFLFCNIARTSSLLHLAICTWSRKSLNQSRPNQTPPVEFHWTWK